MRTPPANYSSEPAIVLDVPLKFVPMPFTAAMMARAMPVAISPYSMAVAPESSSKCLTRIALIAALRLVVMPWDEGYCGT